MQSTKQRKYLGPVEGIFLSYRLWKRFIELLVVSWVKKLFEGFYLYHRR